MRQVVFVQGGGVGLDQEASVRAILRAVGAAVEFEVIPAGRAAVESGKEPLGEELFAAIRKTGVALKTKLLQPKGSPTPRPARRMGSSSACSSPRPSP